MFLIAGCLQGLKSASIRNSRDSDGAYSSTQYKTLGLDTKTVSPGLGTQQATTNLNNQGNSTDLDTQSSDSKRPGTQTDSPVIDRQDDSTGIQQYQDDTQYFNNQEDSTDPEQYQDDAPDLNAATGINDPCSLVQTLPNIKDKPLSETVRDLALRTTDLKRNTDGAIAYLNDTFFQANSMQTWVDIFQTKTYNISGLMTLHAGNIDTSDVPQMAVFLKDSYSRLSKLTSYLGILIQDADTNYRFPLKQRYQDINRSLRSMLCSINTGLLGIGQELPITQPEVIPEEFVKPPFFLLFRDLQVLTELRYVMVYLNLVFES